MHESQAVTSNFRVPFHSRRPGGRIGSTKNKRGESQDVLGRLKNVQFEFPSKGAREEVGGNKRIYKSQPVPLGASQHLELQQWYETRLKNYDSSRLRDAFSSLLQLGQIPKGRVNKWLRLSVPDIEKFSHRSRRPYVGKYNMSRIKTNPAAAKIKLPPFSRQAMDVVTSAHCVHPTTSSNHSLKVEVPESMGYRIHYVDGVYVPRGYRIAKGDGFKPNYAKAVYDYAVMTLNAPIPGREFPRIASVDVRRLGSMGQIHIIGYPTDTYPQMWQSSCSFLDSRPALGGNFVTSSCASPRGMGGAAALLDNVRSRDDMKMIGIATNMVLNESKSKADQKKSLVLLFTPNQVAEICQQIKPWDQGRCA